MAVLKDYPILNRPQFNFIKDKIPHAFFNRKISDLGCGDGCSSQRIKEAFKAKSIVGFEINDYLIKRAKKRGLKVEKKDLEQYVPSGEMATVWGVVHHLKEKKGFLQKIRHNFQYAVFNEPIKTFWAFLDGGLPMEEEKIRNLFTDALGNYQTMRFKNNIFIFWKK